MSTKTSWREKLGRLFAFYGSRSWGWMGVVMGAGFTLVAVEYAVALFLQVFVVSLGIVKPSALPSWLPSWLVSLPLVWALVWLIGIGVVRSVAYFFADWGAEVVRERVQARMRFLTTYEMLYPTPGRVPLGAAEINYRLGELIPQLGTFSHACCFTVVYGVLLLLTLGAMLYFAPKEAILSMVGLGGIGVMILWFNRYVRSYASLVPQHYKQLQQGIARVARNLMFLKVSHTEDLEHGRFVGHINRYFSLSMKAALLHTISNNLAPGLGILLLALIVACSQMVFHSPGVQLLAFLYLFVRFIQQIKFFGHFYGEINRHWRRFEESFHFFHQTPPALRQQALLPYENLRMSVGHDTEMTHSWQRTDTADNETTTRRTPVASSPPAVEIRDVCFRYPTASQDTIHHFHLSVAPGEHLGIVGPSGSGKSTLLGLLLGLYTPDTGSILIGGQEPRSLLEHRVMSVGYVGPEPFLIEGSIRDNLVYGLRETITDQGLWEALHTAQLARKIEQLEGQLDYQILESGAGLSAGEKQRLALARAFLHRPRLLILDEASANLDAATEKAVADAIALLRGTCTAIIVSHREGMLQHVSQIVSLSPYTGEVVQDAKPNTK